MLIRDLSQRDLQPELMDQSDLDAVQHARALAGLSRINHWSRSASMLWHRIQRRYPVPGAPLRILDLASGGGDTCFRIWQLAQRHQYEVQLTGLELSPTAIEIARSRCKPAGTAIDFVQTDVVIEALPERPDVVICSLFLHHLDDRQAVQLLTNVANAQPGMLILSDLLRSRYGYLLAHAACRLLSRSPIVHFDGPQSVAAAFTLSELRSLCEEAGLRNVDLQPCWPARVLLQWEA